MGITSFIGEIAGGITAFLPEFLQALAQSFVDLFFTTAEGGTMTLNTLGVVSISFFVVSLCIGFVPMIASWLKLRGRKKRARKSRK